MKSLALFDHLRPPRLERLRHLCTQDPKTHRNRAAGPAAPEATTPVQLMDNLARAMRTRDKELYESLLDKDFLFTEFNCLGEVEFFNNLEEELEIMAGSRDGSQPGIFDIYRDFDFDFELISRDLELGSEYPDSYPGDPDGHPDEDWEIFRGRVQMLLLDENGDGFRVDQIMNYKLRFRPRRRPVENRSLDQRCLVLVRATVAERASTWQTPLAGRH